MQVTPPHGLESPPWAVITKAGRGDLPVTVATVDGRWWTSIVKSRGERFRACESVRYQPAADDVYFEITSNPHYACQWVLRVRDEFRDQVRVNRNPIRRRLHALTDGDSISVRRSRSQFHSFSIFLGSYFFHYYNLGRFLGRGALSTFYACRRRDMIGGFRAVKVVRHSGQEEPYYTAARHGLAMSTALNEAGGHGNILRMLDLYATPTTTYMVTEGFDENLRQILYVAQEEGRRFAACEFKRLIRDISSGMAFVHRCGIIHRNLNLENIVLCRGVAKIIGFEAPDVRQLREGDPRRRIASASYIPPEARDGGHYDEKYDSWSLGVIAQAVLAGLPVVDRFLGSELLALGLPGWCTELVGNLLRQNPGERRCMACVRDFLE